ncbi:MAG: substrate-binding domain-containing protein [Aeromonas sp.]
MEEKRITITQIAALAGVAKATASLALNGKSAQYRIADDTRARILAIAKAHNYQPSRHARALRQKQPGIWGIVIPDLTNFGFAKIVRLLESHCRQAGIQLLIACSDDDPALEQEAVNSLISWQIDGLIVASSGQSDEIYTRLQPQLPIVQLDRHIQHSSLPLVISNASEACASLVQRMAHACAGDVYYFGGQLSLSPSRHRLAGFKQGLIRAGFTVDEQKIYHRDYQPSSGYQLMAELMAQSKTPPKGLFTSSFTLLEGVLRYLKQHDLLSSGLYLGTFDDHDLLDCLPLPIDSIAQDCDTLARTAFRLMQQLIAAETPLQTTHLISPQICWRRG